VAPERRPGSAGTPAIGSASWEALGTNVVLRVTDGAMLASARSAVEQELAAIDLACSRFRADSELTRVNAAGGQRIRVGALLVEALEVALRAAELSDGDVDPTVGRALELAGYDRDWRLLAPAPGETLPVQDETPPRVLARVRSGWETIELDPRGGTVRVPAGISLDLGSSAKAWAADRAAATAAAASGCGALVSLGGDIGTCGAAPEGSWRVHVTDDHRGGPGAPGQTITISSGGLATSSTTVRRWSHEGRTMHHVIDPATGEPARTPWRTVSVAAGDCTDANTAATAALVRGHAAPAWLEEVGLPARLCARDGEVVLVGDWPRELPAGPSPTRAPAGTIRARDAHARPQRLTEAMA
jgi:FAD:protein FMN transferase